MKKKSVVILYLLFGCTILPSSHAMPHRSIENPEEFKTMLAYTQTPIFVTFSAGWCNVCHTFKNTFGELTENPLFKDKITFVTVDFDKAKSLCSQYTVDRIPTFLYFQNGNVVRKDIGIKRGVDTKQHFEKTLTEVFQLNQSTQNSSSNNQSTLKSTIAYVVVPPLRYIKKGIDWCLDKLTV